MRRLIHPCSSSPPPLPACLPASHTPCTHTIITPPPPQIGGVFVPADSRLYMSFYLAQVLTGTRLATPSPPPSNSPEKPGLGAAAQQRHQQQQYSDWRSVNNEVLRREFQPERWLADAQQRRGLERPGGLLTFSVGPHTCLGMTLYMLEVGGAG